MPGSPAAMASRAAARSPRPSATLRQRVQRLADQPVHFGPLAQPQQRLGLVADQVRAERPGQAGPHRELEPVPGGLRGFGMPPHQFQHVGQVDVTAQRGQRQVVLQRQPDPGAQRIQAGLGLAR